MATAPTTPIVGRDAELEELSGALGLDAAVPVDAVLLGGDAGIGKTRVVRELVERARGAGFSVLLGHCLDLGANTPSFEPVAEMLAHLPDDVRARLLESQPALRGLMLRSSEAEDPDRLRAEVVSAVARGLEVLAADGPVLLVVEDLHWADASTRHLVRYLLARRFTRPVAVLLTYRSDDLHRRHPLREALAEWSRLPSVRRTELGPLDHVALGALLRSRAASRLSADGMEAIIGRAEGNAFYAEELLDAGLADGSLPEDLADLLLVRVDRLGEAARLVVRAVACAGSSVGDTLLRRVVGDVDLDAALREAVDLKVLVSRGDVLVFRHALLAEAVRDDLLPGERRHVHAAFLTALMDDPTLGTAAERALHAHGAAEPATAFAADVRAAEDARRVGGHDEAAGHLQRALAVGDHAPEGTDLVEVVIETADALLASGRVRTAAALVKDRLGTVTDDADRARLLFSAGQIAYLSGTDADADAASLEALEAADAAPPFLRPRIESLRASALSLMRRDDEALERAERALALAEQHGDDQTTAEAQTTIIKLLARSGADPEKTQRRYSEIAQTARRQGDVNGELRALHHLAFVHLSGGALAEGERVFRETMRRGEETGRAWAPYGFDGRFFTAVTCYLRGAWDETLALRVSTGGTRLARACLEAVALLVAAGRGEQPDAADVEQLRARWDLDVALAVHSGTALIDLAADHVQAGAAHDELLEVLDAVWRESLGPQRLRMGGLLIGRLAHAVPHTATGEHAVMLERAEAALEAARASAAAFPQLGPEGRAWLARVEAEADRFRWLTGIDPPTAEALVDGWQRTTEAFEAFGEVYEQARSATRLAQVLKAQGRTSEAEPLLHEARTIAQRLGARPLLAEISGLSTGGEAADRSAELTPREIEVLSLVAAGRTNGDVAAQLFISPKTASVHVSNILAKLGASGRTEAAAIARRRGLVD
ncbi:AAA family ATPase [Aeromicrobium sp. CTD01-1L150]|uniref:helix-turn-helix transcriptional regulator n=1 Tax=Aeromicrobium sp. CTD01-1L150 TaxID=3341830 RepID=UPI0035C1EF44